jgi:hypothetical protein
MRAGAPPLARNIACGGGIVQPLSVSFCVAAAMFSLVPFRSGCCGKPPATAWLADSREYCSARA